MQSPFIELRRRLHQIPEPGFEEFKTQQLLLDYLAGLPQERMTIRTWRTGILVYIAGTNPSRRFGYRADMDGLPITEETSLPFPSLHPGYMHACGHDFHMSIGMGIVAHFANEPMKDDLVVIFQPAEEGPGGALPMLSADSFIEWKPDQMIGLHVAPEYPVGTIATKPEILFANTSELFIDLLGKGGHAAYPHLANDMIVAASQMVGQLQTVVARNINPLDSAVITIGKMTGGTKQNIIAETARLEGTIRTLSADAMSYIKRRIEAIAAGIESSFDCKVSIDYGSNYKQVYNHPELTQDFMSWLRHDDSVQLIECSEAMTGEDFGYFLEQIPGFMFWLGVETPYGLHHSRLEPDERAIPIAIDTVTKYLRYQSDRELK